MKNIISILNTIVDQLKETDIDLNRMNADDLEKVKSFVNQQPYNLWIDNHTSLSPYYVNHRAKALYGFPTNDLTKMGFNLYKNILHPSTFGVLKTTFSEFNQNGTKVHLEVPYVKINDGSYAWVYLAAKAFCFDVNGEAKYILSVIFNIDDLVGLTLDKNQYKDASFILSSKHLYQTLTPREKEILKLIAAGNKNKEIADLLDISFETTKTHRKRIIRKLNVKSAIELVKFANNFD